MIERLRRAPNRFRRLVLADTPAFLGSRLTTPKNPKRLIVLDNIFPNEYSGFRVAEFHTYFDRLSDTKVYSTGSALFVAGDNRGIAQVISNYEQRFPQYRGRVQAFNPHRKLQGGLAYLMFLDQVMAFLPIIERDRIPFAFTLYTLGGFFLDDPKTIEKLRRINHSPYFRKIIVTQNVARDFINSGAYIDPAKMEFVYGVVTASDYLSKQLPARRKFGQSKNTFDICFVGTKYMPRGEDKGYDVFIETAKALCKRRADVRFHVIGRFDGSEMDISEIGTNITFYGTQRTDFFPEFYAGMDIILSPSAPGKLQPGAFDSFPNGSCIEAGICGVAVFVTDKLGQNITLKDGEDIIIVPYDVTQISDIIDDYLNHYDDLCALGQQGSTTFRRVFGSEAQIEPRLRILQSCL
ncbi:MAG: glycosyltransferase family 4 protein [Chloroflexota bacterium]|jgi:glycosyltransferase involved in cell wall biosynthesis|nr:glycosyltransferase family 4 protein [Chloroflexota bacterium]